MIPVGIDAISFYTSRYYLDLQTLAQARGIDPQKYQHGLGQDLMAIAPPDEDIITMAATAALRLTHDIDTSTISMVILATESGVDQSKAAGIWVHNLLNLSASCRVIELKQACYSATCGVQLALPYLMQHPNKKVLLLATDIARYGLRSAGEPTQGCGAAAMLLTANPRLVALDPEHGVYTKHVMDFWRPNYLEEAIVDGKYSTKVYLTALQESWMEYEKLSKRSLSDHDYFCYHIPFTRMAEKAHERLLKLSGEELPPELLKKRLEPTIVYAKKIGNSYTAALYIGLISLLETALEDLSNKRIGFFSYGSGCVAEYFSGTVQPGYRNYLNQEYHKKILAERSALTMQEYEQLYTFSLPKDGSRFVIPKHTTGKFRLERIEAHQRFYESV